MDPRSNEPISVVSSGDSLVLYVNDKNARTEPGKKRARPRAWPVLALLALLTHFLASGSGVAISVLVVRFGLETSAAGKNDVLARILLFSASCTGVVYVLMHIWASRAPYVRSQQGGSPQIYGYFSVAMAVLIARLGVPVWIATVVLNALVAAVTGLPSLAKGIRGNVAWVELLISALALLSLGIVVIVIETTDRPFATSLFSRRSFITAKFEKQGKRQSTFDLSISRQGSREDGIKTEKRGNDVEEARQVVFDRSVIDTPDNSVGDEGTLLTNSPPQRRDPSQRRDTLRASRARSQPVPAALETVFGSLEDQSRPQTSPGIKGDFWRPPTRDTSTTMQQRKESLPETYNDALRPRSEVLSTRYSAQSAVPPPLSLFPNAGAPPMPRRASSFIFAAPIPTRSSQLGPSITYDASTTQPPPSSLAAAQPTWPRQPQRRPALPSLADLPARAAARRRNSLLVRQADLNPGNSTNMARRLSFTRQPAPPSPQPDVVEIPMPVITRRESLTSEDGLIPMEAHPLARNNTMRARLVRNFSRPRARSSMREEYSSRVVSPENDAGSEATPGDEGGNLRQSISFRKPYEDADRGRSNDSSMRSREVRRSQSLPRQAFAHGDRPSERSTLVQVGSQFAATFRSNTTRITDGETQDPTATRRGPGYSTTPAPQQKQKVKGLGQGSSGRLDERVARWRNGVPAPWPEAQPRTSIDAYNTPSSSIPEVAVEGMGRALGQRIRRQGSGKLSRENSVSGRVRRVAQNF